MRCLYCVSPDDRGYEPRHDHLTNEQIASVVRVMAKYGLRRVRITGGEPLVRPDVPELTARISEIPGIGDLSLSTNGILLPRYADALKRSGLKRVNISLDTLQPHKFRFISPAGSWEQVWAGIETALAFGFHPVKINCVLMKGVNDDEILDFVRLTFQYPLNVRFIELMPIGNLAFYNQDHQLPIGKAKQLIAEHWGEPAPVLYGDAVGGGPADVFRLPGAQGTLGFIGACTENFCARCNRMRLSADGCLYPCLGHTIHTDLKPALRSAPDRREEAIVERLLDVLDRKPEKHQLTALKPQGTFRTLRAIGG